MFEKKIFSMEERTKVRLFRGGLREVKIRAAVIKKDPKTMEEALEIAMKKERGQRAAKVKRREEDSEEEK